MTWPVRRRAVRSLRSWQRILADAPRTIRPLLQQLKDGTVRVELDVHEADGVADRLTDGLLGSASPLAQHSCSRAVPARCPRRARSLSPSGF
jgi:hypothetical protein